MEDEQNKEWKSIDIVLSGIEHMYITYMQPSSRKRVEQKHILSNQIDVSLSIMCVYLIVAIPFARVHNEYGNDE